MEDKLKEMMPDVDVIQNGIDKILGKTEESE